MSRFQKSNYIKILAKNPVENQDKSGEELCKIIKTLYVFYENHVAILYTINSRKTKMQLN